MLRKRDIEKKIVSVAFVSLFLIIPAFVTNVSAWSNGGFSADPSSPDYGTHDWMAQHALDWLPNQEKQYILDNLAAYLYGTELPDNGQAPDGIGDTAKHHVYFNSVGVMTDDAAAVRASTEYGNTLGFLNSKDFASAAKYAGVMSHYIADMAVFGHVMGSGTDWGAEKHHSDYEDYVNQRTSSYEAEFDSYLAFDGSLDVMTAYEAAKNLAYDTTFDVDGDLTCVWMDQNYDWDDPSFRDRCGESLNLAVNFLTDVLHTIYLKTTWFPASSSISCSASPPSIMYGEKVEVSGSISPVHAGVTVTLTYTKPAGTTVNRTVTTSSSGTYRDIYVPDQAGSWSVIASWTGDLDHKGAVSSSVSFTVEKMKSSINCSVSPSTITLGQSVNVSGNISPVHSGVTVTLTYVKPDLSTVTKFVESTGDGSYNDFHEPDQSGSWSVKAGWTGDEDHEGAESSSVSFIVKPAVDKTPPVADAGSDQLVNEDTLVTFDGSGSSDNIGIASYTWTFIDVTPQTLTGVKPTYIFITPGTYTVTLNVMDAAGNYDTDTVVITVLDITSPVANAGSDQTVKAGETVSFNSGGSSDNVGIVSYEWDFEDGTTGTGATTTHTYTKPGTYTVTLTVRDKAGNSATDMMTVTVQEVAAPSPISWWIIGVIVAVGTVIALAALRLFRRKT